MGLCVNVFGIPLLEDKDCRERRARNAALRRESKGDKRATIIEAKGDRAVDRGIARGIRLEAGGSTAAETIGAVGNVATGFAATALGVPSLDFGGGEPPAPRPASTDNTTTYLLAGLAAAALAGGAWVATR